jgi:hypothetical protein
MNKEQSAVKQMKKQMKYEESLWANVGTELFVLEWSGRQKCFHIQKLSESIKSNFIYGFLTNTSNDYAPIGVFDDVKDAHQAADKLRTEYDMPDMLDAVAMEL